MSPDRRSETAAQEPPVQATWSRRGVLLAAGTLTFAGLATAPAEAAPRPVPAKSADLPTRADIAEEFAGRKPKAFGMFLAGMVTHGRRGAALTFDACGGPRGSRYDQDLIKTLRKAKVPATLFLNARWISANPTLAADLAADPLFELGNHGWNHRPLTVRGQSAYGIRGTGSPGEAYDEIVRGLDAVAELTGRRPRWYRPGTAWADNVGVAIAHRLGVQVVSYSVNADAGATASKSRVTANLNKARTKDIVLAHFNQPGGKTAEGLAKALPKMLKSGRQFVRLSAALA